MWVFAWIVRPARANQSYKGRLQGMSKRRTLYQSIAMNRIPSLPRSHKGNTELLIWIELFTGYVVAKASASQTAQTVAEGYDECVSRR